MKIERFRKFNTRDVCPGGRLDNDMCMLVKAGNRIFMRGQTGLDLNQNMIDPNDPAKQADQAMRNVTPLLDDVGAAMSDICKVALYLTDRDFLLPYSRQCRSWRCVPVRECTLLPALVVRRIGRKSYRLSTCGPLVAVDRVSPPA